VLIANAGGPGRGLHSRARLWPEKSSRAIDRPPNIVEGKVGGNQSSNKASVTDLEELFPVYYMYVLYQYGPMSELLEGDLAGVSILAIVELIFYIHGKEAAVLVKDYLDGEGELELQLPPLPRILGNMIRGRSFLSRGFCFAYFDRRVGR
jgi:hypothetical protein